MGVYNIVVCGGVAYFLAGFVGSSTAFVGVILRSIGISLSATLAVALIMTPKLLVIEGIVNMSLITQFGALGKPLAHTVSREARSSSSMDSPKSPAHELIDNGNIPVPQRPNNSAKVGVVTADADTGQTLSSPVRQFSMSSNGTGSSPIR
jgi:hypothetical protein